MTATMGETHDWLVGRVRQLGAERVRANVAAACLLWPGDGAAVSCVLCGGPGGTLICRACVHIQYANAIATYWRNTSRNMTWLEAVTREVLHAVDAVEQLGRA